MDIFNTKIGRRINEKLRKYFILPKKRKALTNKDFTIICNNCNGGTLTHDLGMRFNSPTVNLFFSSYDFFDFVENFNLPCWCDKGI